MFDNCWRWAAIATSLAGRTDNEIKNYWNTNLKKRLKQKGLDPIITHKPINSTGIEPKINKPVRSSGSARLLNRVASKYAVDLNRDLLTGLISGNSSVFEDSQNSGEINSPTSTLLNKMTETSVLINTTSTFSGISDSCSFTEFFSNEEISDMYTTVDNLEFMEELKGILSGTGTGVIEDSPEINIADEMDFIHSWNEEDNMVVFVWRVKLKSISRWFFSLIKICDRWVGLSSRGPNNVLLPVVVLMEIKHFA